MIRLNYPINNIHKARYKTTENPQSLNNLKITNAHLVCSAPANTFLSELFTNPNDAFTHDEVIPDSGFKLAWSRIIVFEHSGNTFTIQNLYSYKNNDFSKESLPSALAPSRQVSQIATQAIDTCTLICIVAGNKHILAHVTVTNNETAKMLACIKNELSNFIPDEIKVFASYTDGSMEYDNKQQNLSEILKEAFAHNTFFSLQRNPNSNVDSDYRSHMEFGICVDNSVVKYFGDITRHPSYSEFADDKNLNNWPCVTFECTELNALSNLTSINF